MELDQGEPARENEALGPSSALQPLLGAGLEELLRELLHRVHEIEGDQQRLRLLLDAVVLLAADLSSDVLAVPVIDRSRRGSEKGRPLGAASEPGVRPGGIRGLCLVTWE